jgi:hypothetical protein
MKKSTALAIVGVMAIVALCYIGSLLNSSKQVVEAITAPQVQTVDEERSNVGNGEAYAYEITDISEREMNGVPLNKESDDNRGIMLYKDEVPFEVELGDKIVVVWGEYEDEFVSIERAVQAEDGSYVSEKFYE